MNFMVIYAIHETTSPGVVGAGEQAESQEAEQPVFVYFSFEVIDQIGYRSLLCGFPFMTLGLLSGSVLAISTYESLDFLDPRFCCRS